MLTSGRTMREERRKKHEQNQGGNLEPGMCKEIAVLDC